VTSTKLNLTAIGAVLVLAATFALGFLRPGLLQLSQTQERVVQELDAVRDKQQTLGDVSRLYAGIVEQDLRVRDIHEQLPACRLTWRKTGLPIFSSSRGCRWPWTKARFRRRSNLSRGRTFCRCTWRLIAASNSSLPSSIPWSRCRDSHRSTIFRSEIMTPIQDGSRSN
jgi:hypothetical protein